DGGVQAERDFFNGGRAAGKVGAGDIVDAGAQHEAAFSDGVERAAGDAELSAAAAGGLIADGDDAADVERAAFGGHGTPGVVGADADRAGDVRGAAGDDEAEAKVGRAVAAAREVDAGGVEGAAVDADEAVGRVVGGDSGE